MKYKEYLPDILKENEVFAAFGEAVDPLVGEVVGAIGALPEGYLPGSAEELLPRWEFALGLSGGGSLEERRFAVLSRLAGIRPYTAAQLKRQLSAAMGEGKFALEVWPEEFLLRVSVLPGCEMLLVPMVRELRRMIPANMILETAVSQPEEEKLKVGIVMCVSERMRLRE